MTTIISGTEQNILPASDLTRTLSNYNRAMTCPAAVHWRADSFRASEGLPMTTRRAQALNTVLERCYLPAVPGELLIGVGNLGRRIQADEIAAEVIENDSEYLRTNIGARNFGVHSDHHAPDYAKLIRVGFGGLKEEILASLPGQDATGRVFLESMLLALQGASAHLLRWRQHLREIMNGHPNHRILLEEQADRLERLSEKPPTGFEDALQLVLLYHYMMQLDDRSAMAFGRLDQYLYPAYCADIAAGRIDDEKVQAYLDHLFAKITIDGDVQNIALGGVKPEDGTDATNPLSYMILEACRRIGRAGGNCTARIHKHTPPSFLEKCAEVIRSGIGYPAVFNDEVEIPALLKHGYGLEEARDYCFVGCIEVFLQGKQAPWADSRLNPIYSLNLTLFNGVDSLTGESAGPATEDPPDFESFYRAFLDRCRADAYHSITDWNKRQAQYDDRAMDYTSPLMSALVSDCIRRGRDMNDGGAIHPGNCGFAVMGLASIADCLAIIKEWVYDQPRFTLEQLRKILAANFEGYETERQQLMRGVPKYGNDDDRVDGIAVRFVNDYAGFFDDYRTPQGGRYWTLLGSNVSNIWAGKLIGASIDGRLSGTPISDAASPFFGRDQRGPTATIRSVSKIPYGLCLGGNVVNLKLDPASIKGPEGLRCLAFLIRTCFDLGGSELQFNTTDRKMLEDAVRHPERHENLVVRVSGFSANFIWLDPAVQKDILARTEHAL